jgi:ribosomal protein L40E
MQLTGIEDTSSMAFQLLSFFMRYIPIFFCISMAIFVFRKAMYILTGGEGIDFPSFRTKAEDKTDKVEIKQPIAACNSNPIQESRYKKESVLVVCDSCGATNDVSRESCRYCDIKMGG